MRISNALQSAGLVVTTSTVILAFAGCAPMQPTPDQIAGRKEPMLSAAGFKMVPAETPEKLAHLQSLPQLQVRYFTDPDGTMHYWMADAEVCHCVYVGNPNNYQQYKSLQFQQQLADQQQQSAQMQMEAAQEEQMEFMNPLLQGPLWIY